MNEENKETIQNENVENKEVKVEEPVQTETPVEPVQTETAPTENPVPVEPAPTKVEEVPTMATDMVDDFDSKSGRIAMIILMCALLILIGLGVYHIANSDDLKPVDPSNNGNSSSNNNGQNISTNTDDVVWGNPSICLTTDSKFSDCVKNNITNKKYYSGEALTALGFEKVEYLSNDLEKDVTTPIVPISLDEMEKSTKINVDTYSTNKYKFATITFENKEVNLNYFDQKGEILKSQKISDAKEMYSHFSVYYYQIYVITEKNELYSLYLDARDYNVKKAVDSDNFENYLFKKTSGYVYENFYTLLCNTSADGNSKMYRYVGKTLDGSYYYLDTGDEYNENTYVVYSKTLSILKDRTIVKSGTEYGKASLLILSNDTSWYVIDSNYLLYNSAYELVNSNKKVVGVYRYPSKDLLKSIIVVFEDGSNIFVTGQV